MENTDKTELYNKLLEDICIILGEPKSTTLISSLVKSEKEYDKDTGMEYDTSKLWIDSADQAYSMAFFGFDSNKSKMLALSTIALKMVNDKKTYIDLATTICSDTENHNVYKYFINDENWLLDKLQGVMSESDDAILNLPDIIVCPADVKFSPEVTRLLIDLNITVQRIGVNGKEKDLSVLDVGNVIRLDENYNQIVVKDDSAAYKNAIAQLNNKMVRSKMQKYREIQKANIAKIEDSMEKVDSTGVEEKLNYALSKVMELYKKHDVPTYNHIVGMLSLIPVLDSGLEQPLSQIEKNRLEKMVILHDIGKLVIPNQILDKSEMLNDNELKYMRSHVAVENACLFNNECINEILNDALLHHRGDVLVQGDFDKDTNIVNSMRRYSDSSLALRSTDRLVDLLPVLDVYDALTGDRPYKESKTPKVAISIMQGDISKGTLKEEYFQALVNGLENYEILTTEQRKNKAC